MVEPTGCHDPGLADLQRERLVVEHADSARGNVLRGDEYQPWRVGGAGSGLGLGCPHTLRLSYLLSSHALHGFLPHIRVVGPRP